MNSNIKNLFLIMIFCCLNSNIISFGVNRNYQSHYKNTVQKPEIDKSKELFADRKLIEDDENPDTDPNENLGPDSRWIANIKMALALGDILGISVDYYLWNSSSSMNHLAVALGLDTQQFKFFYPFAEMRYELGKNHRFALALNYALLGTNKIYSDSQSGIIEETWPKLPEKPGSEYFDMHGFSLLAGYSHQGNNRLFFNVLAGVAMIIDYPQIPIYFSDGSGQYITNIPISFSPVFSAKLGYRFQ